MLTTKKNLKVEKGEMANKICVKMVKVSQNGLNMQDVPLGLYKLSILGHIFKLFSFAL